MAGKEIAVKKYHRRQRFLLGRGHEPGIDLIARGGIAMVHNGVTQLRLQAATMVTSRMLPRRKQSCRYAEVRFFGTNFPFAGS